MRRLLVLRPEPGVGATVERARKRGLDAIAAPLFTIEPLAWDTPDPTRFDALLLTSANAVRHAGGQLATLTSLPAYAVGDATADAARNADFAIAAVGDSGIDRLLDSIAPGLRLLHLCGEDRRTADQPRQRITAVPVYRAREVETPDLSVRPGDIALIHSPRAGRRFAALVRDRAGISIAAISEAAAKAGGSGWAAVHSAREPTDDALLALAARLCNNPAPE
jgi:uroporphyrinogen-III synthase